MKAGAIVFIPANPQKWQALTGHAVASSMWDKWQYFRDFLGASDLISVL